VELRNSNPQAAFEWFEKSIRAAKASGVENTLAACYYEYGMALIRTATNPRLAKKLLKRSAAIYRGVGNLIRARAAEYVMSSA
jgi:TPR repeat protein